MRCANVRIAMQNCPPWQQSLTCLRTLGWQEQRIGGACSSHHGADTPRCGLRERHSSSALERKADPIAPAHYAALSPAGSHVKCTVAWNGVECSWDRPCHGSRFGLDVTVLTAPARKPLQQNSIVRDDVLRDRRHYAWFLVRKSLMRGWRGEAV